MPSTNPLLHWLDIRPGEGRKVAVCFTGAFLVMAFMVLGRALRESIFISRFGVEMLPYLMVAVALGSIPVVAVFSRAVLARGPRTVLYRLIAVTAAGLLLLWPVAGSTTAGAVVFYLWTALSTITLTSGFWLLASESFVVRGAKRAFGLIAAGGTFGAMVAGSSLGWFLEVTPLTGLILGLVVVLGLLFVVMTRLESAGFEAAPASSPENHAKGTGNDVDPDLTDEESTSFTESLRMIHRSPYLRTIALIVFVATLASTLIDFQFKDWASKSFATAESLTAFLGSFYGWAGAAALVFQLLIAGRLLSKWGVGPGLSVLPTVLVLGSVSLLAAPGLIVATLVRGADNALRKAAHRPVLEVLFIPVPTETRRRTKSFIDSVIDSLAEGAGAGVIFLCVTLSGLESRYLSAAVLLLGVALLGLARRMSVEYPKAVRDRLEEGTPQAERLIEEQGLGGRDLLSASFTRLDLQTIFLAAGGTDDSTWSSVFPSGGTAVDGVTGGKGIEVQNAAEDGSGNGSGTEIESGPDTSALVDLLARDRHQTRAARAIQDRGAEAVPCLRERLLDNSADFVVRRRIPAVLASIGGAESSQALLAALSTRRFEIRYRSAIALARLRRGSHIELDESAKDEIWAAVRAEVNRERPVWEMQRLLDVREADVDGLVAGQVGKRGELSLEHTFRLLSLVLDPEAVRTAFHGILVDDEKLKSYSLEFLELVLPADIRRKLWPFIGDISERQRKKKSRPVDDVVSDLLKSGASAFIDTADREALRRMMEERRK